MLFEHPPTLGQTPKEVVSEQSIVGLVPALALSEPIQIDRFTLTPISRLGDLDVSQWTADRFREIANDYVKRRNAPSALGVLVEDSAEPTYDLARHALNLVAFACCARGRLNSHSSGGMWVCFPEFFHLSPMRVHGQGKFVSSTARHAGLSPDLKHFNYFWPVDTYPEGVAVDKTLLACFSQLVSKLAKRPSQMQLSAARAVGSAVSAMEAYNDLVPGYEYDARRHQLLVSAFETLLRGTRDQWTKKETIDYVDDLGFLNRELSKKTKSISVGKKKGRRKRKSTSRPGRLIHELYELRHSFSHGLRFTSRRFHVNGDPSKVGLLDPALVVFRQSVLATLDPGFYDNLRLVKGASLQTLARDRGVDLDEYLRRCALVRLEEQYERKLSEHLGIQ